MQILSDPMPAAAMEADVPAVRTFCVVWRRNGGELWKADVTADNVGTAVEAVVYDQRVNASDVVGVIDRTTIR